MKQRELLGRMLLVASVMLAAWSVSLAPELFSLDRRVLMQGQLWRLWSGHLVHGSVAHYAYDVGAAALLLSARRSSRLLLLAFAPALSLLLLGLLSEAESYAGLSAGLHAYAVWIALHVARRDVGMRRLFGLTLAASILGKAGLETALGTSLFMRDQDMGGPVLHASHLVGAVFGAASFALQGLASASGRMRILSHVRNARPKKNQGTIPRASRT